jgi:hypothetical protein
MPDISITDELGTPVESVKIDLSQPSSLVSYARAELLHLIVVPDFLALQDKALAVVAAPTPIQFQVRLGNDFTLGSTEPAIMLSPKVQAVLHADSTHAGLEATGSLAVSTGGVAGDFSFGINAGGSVTIGFSKAFDGAVPAPTLGGAVGQMLSGFVIAASVEDLKLLDAGDVCTVSGQGSLTVSGGFDIAAPVNPLASVKLPLNAGSIDVQDGVMAGVSASITISGSYQIQATGLAGGNIGLRFQKQRSTAMRTEFTASASASVTFRGTDLLSALMGAIGGNGTDPKVLQGLTDDEKETFNAALQEGVNHSLQASLDVALSTMTEDEAIFEYEIQRGALDGAAAALNRALHGDLTALTGGASVAGVTLRTSVLDRVRKHGVTLKVNLLGIVNLISVSNLISRCEVLSDAASGSVTIKETAASERISAISEPLARQEALRKALFESVMVTTTYRASGAVTMPELNCANLHFVVNRNTDKDTVRHYLNWFAALNLIAKSDIDATLAGYGGDATCTCLLRTELDDAACESLFFEGGALRTEVYYREFGRSALRALLAGGDDEIDQARYRMLDDPARWAHAVKMGPSPELRQLIPMNESNPRFGLVLADVQGDLYDIVWWAQSMTQAGAALLGMQQFLKGRDPAGLKEDAEFRDKREALQKLMLSVVGKSHARFGEPWGMITLFWCAGSPAGASGRLQAGAWSVAKGQEEDPKVVTALGVGAKN